MPGPPPPPPPMMSLPVSSDSGGEQGRNMLLQSIRAGKPLKKTVTVDKSAPAIAGKIKGELPSTPSYAGGNNNNSSSNSSSINNNSNTGMMSLGGLFAGGMPKLKPTGLRGNVTERETSTSNSTHSSNSNTNTKRGPPPVPPPATQKPQAFQSVTDSALINSEAPKAFGKLTIVPKAPPPPPAAHQKPSAPSFIAPQKPSPPPKKINLSNSQTLKHSSSGGGGGGGLMRAQSMSVPRPHPVLTPTMSSLHQSQDCLNDPPPPPRPTPRHLRPPVTRPPPPPPSRITAAPTMPPPPPPPPHRSGSTHQRHAPPPPPPPTPPTRVSSMTRNGQSSSWLDFETRFSDAFHSVSSFPLPEPFKGFQKVYNSRNAAKQQAPAPPPNTQNTMLQLNSTHGGRQWPHDAASSAC